MSSSLEPTTSKNRGWLWLCLALHFVLSGIFVFILPLWGAVPDEPLHYSHIKFVGEFWRLPYITDPRTFGAGLSDYCFTADPVGTAQHGPLYYWSAAPLFWITKGLSVEAQLYVLRFWSLLWGAAMLPLVFLTLQRVFRNSNNLVGPLLLCTTLLPHRLLMSSVIYNDITCATMVTLAFFFLSKATEDDAKWQAWVWAGVALGLATLTKRVGLVALPAFLLAIFLQNRRSNYGNKILLQNFVACFGAFLIIAGWWFARDLSLYNELFPTEPSIIRRSWGDLLLYGSSEELRFMFTYAIRGLWLSLWSQVGWLPWEVKGFWGALSLFVYGGFALISGSCALGYFAGIKSKWRALDAYAQNWTAISFVTVLGMIYGALNWVLRFSFHNNEETGKHAISIAVCVLVLLGVSSRFWLGEKKAPLIPLALSGLLAIYDVGATTYLQTVLIPAHRPPTPALAKMRVSDLPSGRAPGIWHRYVVPRVTQMGEPVPRPESAKPPLNFREFPTP